MPVPPKSSETLDAIALAAEIERPVHLVHAGADEVFVPAVYGQLRDVLERRNAATVVQVHARSVHSFTRPELQSVPANSLATSLSWPPGNCVPANLLSDRGFAAHLRACCRLSWSCPARAAGLFWL
jgi:hypothetical protein